MVSETSADSRNLKLLATATEVPTCDGFEACGSCGMPPVLQGTEGPRWNLLAVLADYDTRWF